GGAGGVPSQENLWKSLYYLESLQLAELENFLQCNLQTSQTTKLNRVPTPEEATAILKERIDTVLQADPTAALIYPLLLKGRVAVILKLPGQALRYYPTPISQNHLGKVLEQLPKNLRFAGAKREVQQDAQEVYQWLIEPLKVDLDSSQSKTLVFSLDTPLRNIPMAALYDGKEYLIEKYAVAVISGLELLHSQTQLREPLKALLAGLTETNQGYPPLKNVEGQFKKIESEVPSQVILNQAFTVTNFQKQSESFSFPVIHIATHGEFSSQPEETFIITWNGRLDANALGNLLKSRERISSEPIELLVLAACQTAEGDKWATLGLAGVAVKSGTRSTLATLWKISADESSGDLLSQFYRKLSDNPHLSKAEALSLAQQEFLQDRNRQAPYYWAAYVLIGNWL
ncbi:MAG: CHAT domain-containing protein, partial [Microcystaceae cyanobacterium]